jgi:hypothetical protein
MTISEAVRTRVHTPSRAAKLLRLAASWTLAAQLTGAPGFRGERQAGGQDVRGVSLHRSRPQSHAGRTRTRHHGSGQI